MLIKQISYSQKHSLIIILIVKRIKCKNIFSIYRYKKYICSIIKLRTFSVDYRHNTVDEYSKLDGALILRHILRNEI